MTRSIFAVHRRSIAAPAVDMSELQQLGRLVFERSMQPQLTFLLGGPGSGKGTLSAMMVQRMKFCHVSMGALLRAEVRTGSRLGAAIHDVISTGGIVPSTVSTKLLLQHLNWQQQTQRAHSLASPIRWVVDGFPRKLENAEYWEYLGFAPRRVLALEVDEDELVQRLEKRKRSDDQLSIIQRRLEGHNSEWPSLRNFYHSRGLLTILDGEGCPEKVWNRLLLSLQK